MDTPERKPAAAGDFESRGVGPGKKSAILRTQMRLSHSMAWPIVARDYESVAEGLRHLESIAVEVRCGAIRLGGDPVIRSATLRRTNPDAAPSIDLELRFAETLPSDIEPFAVYAGRLDIWRFEQAALESAPLLRLAAAPGNIAAAPEHSLAAAGAQRAGALEVANERLRLRWKDNLLLVILDQPPLRRGQPLVVEVQSDDDLGRRRSYRRALSIEHDISEGDHAGFAWGDIGCHEPARCKRYKIAARPLEPDELHLLDSRQLTCLLAGQQIPAMNVKPPDCRFAAGTQQQQRAVADAASAWFLRVARKEAAS